MKPKTALIIGASILTPLIVALAMSDAPRTPTPADHVITPKVACLTADAFDQWVTAKTQDDQRGMEFLANRGLCIVLPKAQPVSLLSSSWGGNRPHPTLRRKGEHRALDYSEAVIKK
ncbi:MAG: hypothetical protein HYY96_15930 [Candidatus Tectomicrobia bacterium]|nr:hypothetical protein [Candidatus Tectomicrobia bacterium]